MDFDELMHIAQTAGRLSEAEAAEIMNYGISEILKYGSYDEALVILEKAEIALKRARMQRVTNGSLSVGG